MRDWGKFYSHTRFEVGDGSKVSFWHDPWCWGMAFKETFPYLYGIAYANDASIATHLEILGGSNQRNISLVRAAHDWKVDVFASFFRMLYSARLR